MIGTEKTFRFDGITIKFGTFNKHNPKVVYIDGILAINGETADYDKVTEFDKELLRILEDWKQNLGDYYDKQWIRVINAFNHLQNKYANTKRKHFAFEATLKLNNPNPKWKEVVKEAEKNLYMLSEMITESALKYGFVLYGTTNSFS